MLEVVRPVGRYLWPQLQWKRTRTELHHEDQVLISNPGLKGRKTLAVFFTCLHKDLYLSCTLVQRLY